MASVTPGDDSVPVLSGKKRQEAYADPGAGRILTVNLPSGPGALSDPAARAISSWDANGDGTLDYAEVKVASRALLEARAAAKSWRRMFFVLGACLAVLLAVFFAVALAADEVSRETAVSGDDSSEGAGPRLLSKSGVPLETDATLAAGPGLWDYYGAEPGVLDAVERIELPTGAARGVFNAKVLGWMRVAAIDDEDGPDDAETAALAEEILASEDNGEDDGDFDEGGAEIVDVDGTTIPVSAFATNSTNATTGDEDGEPRVVFFLDNGGRLACGRTEATLTLLDAGVDDEAPEGEDEDEDEEGSEVVTYVRGAQDMLTGEYDIEVASGANVFGEDPDPVAALSAEVAAANTSVEAAVAATRARHGPEASLHHGFDPLLAAALGRAVPASVFGTVDRDGLPRSELPERLHELLASSSDATVALMWAGHDDPRWHAENNPHWTRRCTFYDSHGRGHILKDGLAGVHRDGHHVGEVHAAARIHPLQSGRSFSSVTFSYASTRSRSSRIFASSKFGTVKNDKPTIAYPGEPIISEEIVRRVIDALANGVILGDGSQPISGIYKVYLRRFYNRVRHFFSRTSSARTIINAIYPKARQLCALRGTDNLNCLRQTGIQKCIEFCEEGCTLEGTVEGVRGEMRDDRTSSLDWPIVGSSLCSTKPNFCTETCSYMSPKVSEALSKGQPVVNDDGIIEGMIAPSSLRRVPCPFPKKAGVRTYDPDDCDPVPIDSDRRIDTLIDSLVLEQEPDETEPRQLTEKETKLLEKVHRNSSILDRCGEGGPTPYRYEEVGAMEPKFVLGAYVEALCPTLQRNRRHCFVTCFAGSGRPTDLSRCAANCTCKGMYRLMGRTPNYVRRRGDTSKKPSCQSYFAKRRTRKVVTKTVEKVKCTTRTKTKYMTKYF